MGSCFDRQTKKIKKKMQLSAIEFLDSPIINLIMQKKINISEKKRKMMKLMFKI